MKAALEIIVGLASVAAGIGLAVGEPQYVRQVADAFRSADYLSAAKHALPFLGYATLAVAGIGGFLKGITGLNSGYDGGEFR